MEGEVSTSDRTIVARRLLIVIFLKLPSCIQQQANGNVCDSNLNNLFFVKLSHIILWTSRRLKFGNVSLKPFPLSIVAYPNPCQISSCLYVRSKRQNMI